MPGEPSAADLLTAWERGRSRPTLERPLSLLAALHPSEPLESLSALPLGRRDARLLRLRADLFGRRVVATAACPECEERLELSFDVDDVAVAAEEEPAETYAHLVAGHDVRFRLPTTEDLAHAARDPDAARSRLLEQCVLHAETRGVPVAASALPEEVIVQLGALMERADPQADVRLVLDCPACGHRWRERFDVASFLWSEVSTWARGLLTEVAALARAYGWGETEVLAMSPERRQAYLDLAAT